MYTFVECSQYLFKIAFRSCIKMCVKMICQVMISNNRIRIGYLLKHTEVRCSLNIVNYFVSDVHSLHYNYLITRSARLIYFSKMFLLFFIRFMLILQI